MSLLETAPDNLEIFDCLAKTENMLKRYENILCSVSGGSDSDILIDLLQKFDCNVRYVFFDTGLEYKATKDHLKELEEKYGIKIEVVKAVKPIPLCTREYGQPFLSKMASEMITRLQRHGFQWEDEPLEVLLKRYPKCQRAIRWWCNDYGEKSKFNINYNKWLKEFMIANPPEFKISNKCCEYAKKKPAKLSKKQFQCDLSIVGVRKSEGGARSHAYKSCFTSKEEETDEYRPIFWFKDDTKRVYNEWYGVSNSRCYAEYGLRRTGCAGCPFGRDFEKELEIIEKHEPMLFRACNKIFGDAYEYTRKYKVFREDMENAKRMEE